MVILGILLQIIRFKSKYDKVWTLIKVKKVVMMYRNRYFALLRMMHRLAPSVSIVKENPRSVIFIHFLVGFYF